MSYACLPVGITHPHPSTPPHTLLPPRPAILHTALLD